MKWHQRRNAVSFELEEVLSATGVCFHEGTFARRVPGIQINVPVVHPNALPLDTIPSSSPGTLSTNDTTKHNCK